MKVAYNKEFKLPFAIGHCAPAITMLTPNFDYSFMFLSPFWP
jgi:hypothetical protein